MSGLKESIVKDINEHRTAGNIAKYFVETPGFFRPIEGIAIGAATLAVAIPLGWLPSTLSDNLEKVEHQTNQWPEIGKAEIATAAASPFVQSQLQDTLYAYDAEIDRDLSRLTKIRIKGINRIIDPTIENSLSMTCQEAAAQATQERNLWDKVFFPRDEQAIHQEMMDSTAQISQLSTQFIDAPSMDAQEILEDICEQNQLWGEFFDQLKETSVDLLEKGSEALQEQLQRLDEELEKQR